MSGQLTVATFPRDDAAFGAYVERCRAELNEDERADPAALQRAIRRWHTRAVVRAQDALAGFGSALWYVYRDGMAGVRTDDTWWQEQGVAHVIFAPGGHVHSADREACSLVGRPAGGLDGVHWTSLVPPEGSTDDALWISKQLDERGVVQSVFDCPLPDGSRHVIEYRTTPAAQPGFFESRWRHVATIEPDRLRSERALSGRAEGT
jgi:PAS domain-containing protein